MKMERWKLNLYTLWVTQVFSLMSFGMGMPFIPYYLQEMGVSNSAKLSFYVGLSATLPAATMAIAAPIWGIVSDIYGRKMMIMRAMIAASILLILMGTAKSVTIFLILRALQGIFTGTVTASMTFVSANTPESKMSFALGFMTSSNFIGYSIGPIMGSLLAETMGFKTCFVVGGITMIVGYVMVLFLVKEDKNTYGRRLKIKDKEDKKKYSLLNKFVIATILMLFVAKVARTMFSPFVALFVQERLGTMVGAAAYTGGINAATGIATAVAALTITRFGDTHDKIKLVLVLTTASFCVSLLLLPNYSLMVFIFVYGLYFFIAGGIEPILTSAVSEKTNPIMRGTLFGILQTTSSVAMMVAPMIGAATSVRFSINALLVLIPICTGVQLIAVMLVEADDLKVMWKKINN